MAVIQQFLMKLIDQLYSFTGNYGWSVILLAAIIKLALYYPTNQQYKAMKDMQAIQPEMKRIQEKYKGDQQKMNTEMMLLYKKHKVNPFGGCLPLIIQMPILWGIWHTISSYKHVFEQAYFLWIGSPLSFKYADIFARNLAGHDVPLLLLYGFSMYLTQKATAAPSDPAAAKTQQTMSLFMPFFFTYMMWQWKFPCALILYWLVFNILSIFQQCAVMKPKTQQEGMADQK